MTPTITFKCTNEECEHHAKELKLHYSSIFGSMKVEHGEDYWTARLKHCRSCYRTGEVKIEHGSRILSDIEPEAANRRLLVDAEAKLMLESKGLSRRR